MQRRSTPGFALAGTCTSILFGALLVGCVEPDEAEPWQPPPQAELLPENDGYLADYGVSCRIESLDTDDGVVVRMTLFNDNDDEIEFLEWQTLWDAFYPLFEFPSAQGQVSYRGWRASRGEPAAEAFAPIAPNGSVTTDYRLGEHYLAESAGSYAIRLDSSAIVVRDDGELLRLQHACGEGLVHIDTELDERADGFGTIEQGLEAHDGCNANAERILNNAAEVAHSAVTAGRNAVFEDSSLYAEWYGEWTEWNGDEVYAHMDQILEDRWDSVFRCGGTGDTVFNCCSDNIACALDAGPFGSRLYVCSPWFDLPTLSVEASSSQAGVLVHEMTHAGDPRGEWGPFGWVLTHPFGTDDLGYGAGGARAHASNCSADQCAAVRNAENYEHFVSNALVTTIVTSTL